MGAQDLVVLGFLKICLGRSREACLQPPAASERQMAHLKEQLPHLRGRIEQQRESVRKHSEQLQLIVDKLEALKQE